MGLLQRFDPPAFLSDFDGIPGQHDAWHQFISGLFDSVIDSERPHVKRPGGQPGTVQYYNPAAFDPGGPLVEQPIVWNAFPKELLRRFGRTRALVEADHLWPLRTYFARNKRQGSPAFEAAVYRPLDEYCEWHVVRNPDTHQIRRVTFTSEPPEYWQSLFGGVVPMTGVPVAFPGDRDRLLALYRELVSPEVELDDLICHEDVVEPSGQIDFQKGDYNVYNKWNTTHGIVHLCAPPNYISAEIQLGGDGTVLYQNAHGEPVVEPEALICCAGYGGPDRNSDPTIGATVNALARLGAMVTLLNPVGLYMDHIDLTGWSAPPGVDVDRCVRIARGAPGRIERLVVEVPPRSGFTVGDLRIGGVPIEYGGQIAECITVKLVGAAASLGTVQNAPGPCRSKCCLDPANAVTLDRLVAVGDPAPPGTRAAFEDEGGLAPTAATRAEPRAYPRATRARL